MTTGGGSRGTVIIIDRTSVEILKKKFDGKVKGPRESCTYAHLYPRKYLGLIEPASNRTVRSNLRNVLGVVS